jgi:hypothetical protein
MWLVDLKGTNVFALKMISSLLADIKLAVHKYFSKDHMKQRNIEHYRSVQISILI